jgi:outer membrane protein
MFFRILFTLISFLVFFHTQAQIFTLKQCVDEGVKNNIQLKQSELSISTQDINLTQSKAALLPNLNANASQGWNFGRVSDPSTNQFINQEIRSNNFGISSNVTLFNGFRLINTVKTNENSKKASEYEYQDSKNTVILNIINSYIQVLFNKELVKTAQNLISVTGTQLQRTEKMVKGGSLPESNLFDLISKKNTDELSLTNAENQLIIAKLNLIQQMNIPISEEGINAFDIDSPIINLDTTQSTESSKEIFQFAEQNQPSILGSKLRVRSSEIAIDAAKGNLYPRLTLSAGINTVYSSARQKIIGQNIFENAIIGTVANSGASVVSNTPLVAPIFGEYKFFPQVDDNLSQFVSLNLSIPIFNGYSARTSVQNSVINKKNAELNYQNSKNQLRRRIEQAYVDEINAKKRLDAIEAQIKALQESFRVTEKRFNAGVIHSVDYNLVSNNLFKAQSDYLQAKYDLFLKSKILDFYKGNELVY